MNLFFHIGRYFMLLRDTFSSPERLSLYWKRTVEEMDLLGVKSIGIVALLSVFMGAVITIQTSSNIDAAWIPSYLVGFTVRQSTVLEFSPTIISLILAGKVGSNIAAEIGSMRVSERCLGHYGRELGRLPYPSQDRGFYAHESIPDHAKHVPEHRGWLAGRRGYGYCELQ